MFDLFEKVAELAKQKLPDTCLIISEITPRMDHFNRDVFQINSCIQDLAFNDGSIILIRHNDLRNYQSMKDNKHVSEDLGIQTLAGNLKYGIRRAFGIQSSGDFKTHYSNRQNWRAPALSLFGTSPRAPQGWQRRFDNVNLNPHNYHKETERYEDSTPKSLDQRIGHLILMLSNGQMPIKSDIKEVNNCLLFDSRFNLLAFGLVLLFFGFYHSEFLISRIYPQK